jgi:RNA 2',3'-cyclic 3'-phosphodiesterase
MARPSANLRLFVAVYPPRELAEDWARRVKAMRDLPPYRLTPIEQIHLTLQFIGDTPVKNLEPTIESCRRAAKGLGCFELAAQEFITLPERGPKRLIAVETDAPPTLLELKRRLAMRLASNVRENPARKFRPHLTVCRFRSPAPGAPGAQGERGARGARGARMGRGGRFDPTLTTEPFVVSELLLMKSALSPSGAAHTVVERIQL